LVRRDFSFILPHFNFSNHTTLDDLQRRVNAQCPHVEGLMLADVDLLEQDIAIEERAAKLTDEQRSAGRPPRAQPGEGTTAIDETRAAEKERGTLMSSGSSAILPLATLARS
jgi:hypothetical protein